MILILLGALEQLKIIPKSSLAPNPISSPSTTNDRLAIAGTNHGTPDLSLDIAGHTEQLPPKRHKASNSTLDVDHDAQQPPSKKAAVDVTLKAESKSERPLPQVKTEEESKHKDQISVSNTPAPQSNLPPPFELKANKLSPIVIKDEDEGEDLVILSAGPISRARSSNTPAQAQVFAAAAKLEDQAKRERKKAILNKRLEQLKVEREQLKIEQELLEMEEWNHGMFLIWWLHMAVYEDF